MQDGLYAPCSSSVPLSPEHASLTAVCCVLAVPSPGGGHFPCHRGSCGTSARFSAVERHVEGRSHPPPFASPPSHPVLWVSAAHPTPMRGWCECLRCRLGAGVLVQRACVRSGPEMLFLVSTAGVAGTSLLFLCTELSLMIVCSQSCSFLLF